MRWPLFAVAAISLATSGAAVAQTTLPLNTGYNYQTFGVYPQPANGLSTVQDNYWIKIASYEPPASSVPVAPAWVLPASPPPPWATPLPGSRWIGPRQVAASAPGTTPSNPGYSIFRKCFCLMRGYKEPSIKLQSRADDDIQIWLNSIPNTLVGPVIGNWGGGATRDGGTSDPSKFRTGRNCIYVLVEDFWGQMGFDLAGAVTAYGLMPMAAAGTNGSFAPCQCEDGHPGAGGAKARAMSTTEDRDVVQAIIKIAEERRTHPPARPPEPAKPRN